MRSTATASCARSMPRRAAISTWPRISRPAGASCMKTPAVDLQGDPELLERFMLEEWIARRLEQPARAEALSANARAPLPVRRDGIRRGPDPRAVDDRQPAARPRDGARHRRADRPRPAGLPSPGDAASGPASREHHDRQDRHGEDHRLRLGLRGGRRRAGVAATSARGSSARFSTRRRNISSATPGASARTCISLGVIAYQMLSGRLPYGAEAARVRTRAAQRKLRYATLLTSSGTRSATSRRGSTRRSGRPSTPSRSSATRPCRNSSTTCGTRTRNCCAARRSSRAIRWPSGGRRARCSAPSSSFSCWCNSACRKASPTRARSRPASRFARPRRARAAEPACALRCSRRCAA